MCAAPVSWRLVCLSALQMYLAWREGGGGGEDGRRETPCNAPSPLAPSSSPAMHEHPRLGIRSVRWSQAVAQGSAIVTDVTERNFRRTVQL